MICPEKYVAIADIRRHLATVGSKRWQLVRARYPRISSASFFRYVREAKSSEFFDENVRVMSCRPVSTPSVPSHVMYGELAVADTDPVPRRFDYLANFRQLFADATALRAYALNADSSIKFPVIFDRALRVRLKLISRAVRLTRQIYEGRNVQIFMDALVNEIALESPELQRRLIARLRVIASSHGSGAIK